jgi:CRP/FNR family transcriptional regulator, cyclic AMP receptor protein
MTIAFQNLLKFQLLRDMPQAELLRLSTHAELVQVSKREVLFAGKERSFPLGFLLEGRLQGVDFTVDGRGVGLYYVERGDFFGEQAVVDGEPLNEHVVAASKSTVIWLESTAARELIQNNPLISLSVMKRLSQRVRSAHAQRTLLALPNPFQKLCAQILLLSTPASLNEAVVSPVPTHQELALMINVSRETVTRAFQQLLLAKALGREGSELRLLRLDHIQAIARGAETPPKG